MPCSVFGHMMLDQFQSLGDRGLGRSDVVVVGSSSASCAFAYFISSMRYKRQVHWILTCRPSRLSGTLSRRSLYRTRSARTCTTGCATPAHPACCSHREKNRWVNVAIKTISIRRPTAASMADRIATLSPGDCTGWKNPRP